MADGYWNKRYLRGNTLVVALAFLVLALRTTAGERITGSLDWPRQWIVFGPLLEGDKGMPGERLAAVPDVLEINGKVLKPKLVDPGADHLATLANVYEGVGRYTTAYIFLPLQSPDDREVTLGMGGNWWMQAWMNGKLIFDTTKTSNIKHPIAVDNHLVNARLREGRNVLAVRFICGSGGTEIALGGPNQLRGLKANRLPPPLDLDEAKTVWEASVFDDDRSVSTGEGVELRMERNYARPGERYLEYFIRLDPKLPLKQSRLRISVIDIATGAKVHEETVSPREALLLQRLDLRSLGLTKARLRLELVCKGQRIGAAEAAVCARSAAPAPGKPVPVMLNLPDGVDSVRDYPVTFGAPFPAGSLWDVEAVRLVDLDGQPVPFQAEVTGRWAPEGAIKWVRFDALADSGRGLALAAGAPAKGSRPARRVTVVRNGALVEVDTGAARHVIEGGGALIKELHAGDRTVVRGPGRGLYVIDQRGRTATADATDAAVEIESGGPVAACVKIEGVYRTPKKEEVARHITRLEFFAGRSEARVTHTLVLTRNTNDVWFREIGWEVAVEPGRKPNALLNTSAADASEYEGMPLEGAVRSACLFQAEGERLTLKPHSRMKRWITTPGGKYACVVAAADGEGRERVVSRGERMGDWTALASDRGGLVMVCRDAARQHPKDFEVLPDRMVMRLFSHRGGEELDFRFEALTKRWGLTELGKANATLEELKAIAAHESNAIGWSRTHHLLIAPLPAEKPAESAAWLGRLHTDEVFAHIDPAWIHRSRSMGPVYPRDRERFPEAESMVDHYMTHYGTNLTPGRIYQGFVDYYAGPHYNYPRRYHQVYDLLTGYWTVYARSGDRAYRRAAQGAVRAYFDARLAHWDGPGKVRGLINVPGGAAFTGKSSLPYYWGDHTATNQGNSADLQRVIWDYYLTGRRRSRDIVRNYGEGLLRAWRPGGQVFSIRPVVRLIYQAYEMTWAPRLRILAEASTTKDWFDPRSEVLSTKNQPYRSTLYKTPYDMDTPVEIWELTGFERYRRMAYAMAEHNWRNTGIAGRQSGRAANFYYYQTRSPAVAADLAHFLPKQAGHAWRPEANSYVGITWSNLSRFLRGVPYAMDVAAATDAHHRMPAALLDFEVEDGESSVFVQTDGQRPTDLLIRGLRGKPYGGGLALIPHAKHGRRTSSGQKLYKIEYVSAGFARVFIPYDAMPGVYEIKLLRPGAYTVIVKRRVPLVFGPASPWRPAYTRPGVRFYFNLPQDSTSAKIRFENGALVYPPDGTAQNDGKPVRGWHDLPGDSPGLWSFELTAPGEVEGMGFQQVYGMGDAKLHFRPELTDSPRG